MADNLYPDKRINLFREELWQISWKVLLEAIPLLNESSWVAPPSPPPTIIHPCCGCTFLPCLFIFYENCFPIFAQVKICTRVAEQNKQTHSLGDAKWGSGGGGGIPNCRTMTSPFSSINLTTSTSSTSLVLSKTNIIFEYFSVFKLVAIL